VPTREPKNLAASVRQKLFGLARARNEDFGLMLVKYGLERILYRLSRSKHRDAFVLKGALLFELWTHRTYRATRDADFLVRGDNDPERFVTIFKELCVIDVGSRRLSWRGKCGVSRVRRATHLSGSRVDT